MTKPRYKIARLMQKLFRGRDDRIIVDSEGHIRTEVLDGPLDFHRIADEHLRQTVGLGVFVVRDDSQVNFAAIDFDNKEKKPNTRVRQ